MRVAYLINQYPKISHTFVRREIDSLEHAGIEVHRYSLRRAVDQLVDAADQREAALTTVILQQGPWRLLGGLLSVLLSRPGRAASALRLAVQVGRRSERGFLINLIYLAEACALLLALQQRPVDWVHAHFGTNAATVAMLCTALGGPSFSFTVHGPEEFDKPDLLHLRSKIARAGAVFAVSNYGRSQVWRYCDHTHWSKVHIVPCGVDDDFLESPAAPIPAGPQLVSVGRLSPQKGQLLLLEALGELHRKGRAFHLTMVGDGELRTDLVAMIERMGIADKITLTGWADEAAVRRHVLAARALVVPSFAEGLPVVIMEALALGRPVIATYIAGIPELVEHGVNGWLVPAGSVEALVVAMEQAMDASPAKLEAMGSKGRQAVSKQHDMRKIGPELARLLRALSVS